MIAMVHLITIVHIVATMTVLEVILPVQIHLPHIHMEIPVTVLNIVDMNTRQTAINVLWKTAMTMKIDVTISQPALI